MRILFLSHYYPPEVNAPASRTSEHCERWAAAGHNVTVVTCVPNCPDGVVFDGYKSRFRRQVEVVNGVRIVRVWTFLAANAGTVRRTVNYISYMLSAIWTCLRLPRPDVVVSTSPQFFCGWAGVWVSRLRRTPFVLEIRDIWPESIAAVGAMQRGPVLRFLEWLERRMYAAADHVVTVGNGYRDQILRKASRTDPISIIMNGVDLDQFDPRAVKEATSFRRAWNLENQFVCSYIGTIGMAHGLEIVLETAAVLQQQGRTDVAFVLVGDGARRGALEQEAKVRGLTSIVRFIGRQPRSMMPEILSASDACLVHLRGSELFGSVVPSKIFETMAMQRPIIMGVRGEALDLIRKANAGVPIQPESAEELLAAIDKLASHETLRQEMGVSARAYVTEHFNRDQIASRYLELLERVCGIGEEQQLQHKNAFAAAGSTNHPSP